MNETKQIQSIGLSSIQLLKLFANASKSPVSVSPHSPVSSNVCNAQLWSASQFVFIETTPKLCKPFGNAEPAVNKLKATSSYSTLNVIHILTVHGSS